MLWSLGGGQRRLLQNVTIYFVLKDTQKSVVQALAALSRHDFNLLVVQDDASSSGYPGLKFGKYLPSHEILSYAPAAAFTRSGSTTVTTMSRALKCRAHAAARCSATFECSEKSTAHTMVEQFCMTTS